MGSLSGRNCNNKRFKGYTGIGSKNVAKVILVKGRTFANPRAHPHSNYMGVSLPPGRKAKPEFRAMF